RTGRQRSGRTRTGAPWMRAAPLQAAKAVARMKPTARAVRFRRSAACRGPKKAPISLAQRELVMADQVLVRREPSHALGADDLTRLEPEVRAKHLVRQLGRLGCAVGLHPRMDSVPLVS